MAATPIINKLEASKFEQEFWMSYPIPTVKKITVLKS